MQDVVVTILFHCTGVLVVDTHHLVTSIIKTWDTMRNGLICLRGFSLYTFSLQNPLLHRAWNEGCCCDVNVDLKSFINVHVIKLNVQKLRWQAFLLELPLSGAIILSFFTYQIFSRAFKWWISLKLIIFTNVCLHRECILLAQRTESLDPVIVKTHYNLAYVERKWTEFHTSFTVYRRSETLKNFNNTRAKTGQINVNPYSGNIPF